MTKLKITISFAAFIIASLLLAANAYAARVIGFNQMQFGSDLSLNSSTLTLYTANVSRIFVANNGLMGINTTSPAQTLTVQGTLNVTPAGQMGNASLFVTSGGNVGIGTSAPLAALHIKRNSNPITQDLLSLEALEPGLTLNATRTDNGKIVTAWTLQNQYPASSGFSSLYLNQNGVTRVTFDRNGSVGIGQTNPSYLLEVASGTDGRSVNLSNVLYVNGSSGNVGIGTTTPTEKLHIKDGNIRLERSATGESFNISERSGNPEIALINPTSGTFPGFTISGQNNTGKRTYVSFDGARTGIGTASPGATIEIINQNTNDDITGFKLTHVAITQPYVAIGKSGGSAGDAFIINKDGNVGINDSTPTETLDITGTLSIKSGQSGNAQGLYQNAAGNVGIGTTSPSVTGKGLHVNASGDAMVKVDTSGVSGGNAYFVGTSGTPAGAMYVTNTQARPLYLGTGSSISTNLTIDSAGNVGIGTTSPTSSLQVIGNFSAGEATVGAVGNLQLVAVHTSPLASRLIFGSQPDGWQFRIASNQAGTINDILTIVDHGTYGNVGIGTASPGALLEVNGSGVPYIYIRTSSTSGDRAANVQFLEGTTNKGWVGYWNHSGLTGTPASLVLRAGDGIPIAFRANDVQSMFIDTSGRVGIGTTNPSGKLEIKGSLTGDTLLVLQEGHNAGGENYDINFQATDQTVAARIRTITGASNNADDMTFWTRPTGSGVVTERMRIDSSGVVTINGTLQKGTTAYNNPDIAEKIPSAQLLEEGDLVIVDENNNNHVKKSTQQYQDVIGVVSPNAALVIGNWRGGFDGYAIALLGRVAVKISMK